MNALKMIAGLALVCMTGTSYAQSCAGHAHSTGNTATNDMAAVSKELNLTAEQQTAFTAALAACEKDCSAMAGTDKTTDMHVMSEKKTSRFNEAITSMKTVLNADQYAQLEQMNTSGKLAGLCGSGKSGAGKSAKAGCCAGKAGAHAQPANTEPSPTIQ